MLIQLKHSDIKAVREDILIQQNYTCPITKEKLTVENSVLDHKHKHFSGDVIGENGVGLVRGVLHRQVNAWEGKIVNSFIRLGLHNLETDLPSMLRHLADYLEQGTTNYIHPTEMPKQQKITKTSFNKLCKSIKDAGKKVPEYPKSGKLTNKLAKLYADYGIEVDYYK